MQSPVSLDRTGGLPPQRVARAVDIRPGRANGDEDVAGPTPGESPFARLGMREFAELLARQVAARSGVPPSAEADFVDVLGQLGWSGQMPRQIFDPFHVERPYRFAGPSTKTQTETR